MFSEFGLLLRRLRLAEAAYYAAMLASMARNFIPNRRFDRAHPELVTPPDALLFETGTTTNHELYWRGGQGRARLIFSLLDAHLPNGGAPVRVCEWGCGPGRVIRHLPSTQGPRPVVAFGTDYSPRSIAWCVTHIPNVTFSVNRLEPPLAFDDNTFDCVYSFSVFTHLPLDLQRRWVDEHLRVLRPGGLLIFTVHGDAYRSRLTPAEQAEYDRTGIVMRSGVAEGGPWYTTYQQPAQVERDLVRGLEVLHRQVFSDPQRPAQDIWAVRKPLGA
jgi:SAM-dependent methyltransferase